jgi:type I restriction enzyme S subunit
VDSAQTYRQIGVRSHGKGIFHKEAVTGTELGDKRVFHVVPDALVVNIVFAWEQAVALTSDAEAGFVASHRFPMFTEKGGKSYLPFLRQMFLTKRGKLLLEMASPGGAGRNKTLGQQEFLKLKPVVPSRAEQKKIADAIGAVDAKLAALTAKQAALGRFKAGLMQKLFNQQSRFKRDDGKAFPDWEERRLGDVFTWVKTNSLSREFLTHDGGEVQNIHYGDIHTKFRPLFRQASENVPFVGANSALKPFTDDEYCRVGDVVIADASEDYADIGKAIEIVEVRERSMVAGLHTYIARPKIGSLVVGFSGYMLRSAPMRRQVMRIAQGISVLGVSRGNLEGLTFWLPHPDEQTKIADALSAMDAKIQAVADQVARLQTFKKGLLQQMFV